MDDTKLHLIAEDDGLKVYDLHVYYGGDTPDALVKADFIVVKTENSVSISPVIFNTGGCVDVNCLTIPGHTIKVAN